MFQDYLVITNKIAVVFASLSKKETKEKSFNSIFEFLLLHYRS